MIDDRRTTAAPRSEKGREELYYLCSLRLGMSSVVDSWIVACSIRETLAEKVNVAKLLGDGKDRPSTLGHGL